MSFDPRDTPVNDRVVARWLADRFPDRAPVDPKAHYVSAPVLDLSLTPGGRRDRQLIYGAGFDVLEVRDGIAFGQSQGTVYTGWVDARALALESERPDAGDHVITRQTHAYTKPDLKSPEAAALTHHSKVASRGREGAFVETELGWIPGRHLAKTGSRTIPTPVEVAKLYLGAPYLWGGNSCWGIDCSGLVQVAYQDWTSPDFGGDSDQQRDRLGQDLPDGTPPEANDLFFWPGHVAIAVDGETLIHANGHHMAVVFEPIADTIARIDDLGEGPLLAHKRVPVSARR